MDEILIGGISGIFSSVLTHPLDVIKVRMQLQGELSRRRTRSIVYKYPLQAARIIYHFEGPRGFTRGLVPALLYQVIFSGIRLGCYQIIPFDPTPNVFDFYTRFWASTIPSALGCIATSPLYMIKIRLQSKTPKEIAHGFQHEYEGSMLVGFRKMYTLCGLKCLYGGFGWNLPLMFFGSALQLISYDYTKFYLRHNFGFEKDGRLASVIAALVGGVGITLAAAPGDVVATRMYNQELDRFGRGHYSGFWDCWYKTLKTEGFSGLYKGARTFYFRMGPFTLISLGTWEELKKQKELSL